MQHFMRIFSHVSNFNTYTVAFTECLHTEVNTFFYEVYLYIKCTNVIQVSVCRLY